MAVGIDTTGGAVGGFDAASWTDPVIVGDADGDGKLTGADASLVAQKSVHLPTPQIPDLPGIPLTPNGGGGSLALDNLAPQTASVLANSAPPAAVGVLVEASSVIVTAPVVNTARPLVSASSAALTTVTTTLPASGPLVLATPADWSAATNDVHPAPTPSTSTPLAPATPALDHYFAQLPTDVAAEPPLSGNTANVNSDADDATDRFYEDLAQDAEAELLPA